MTIRGERISINSVKHNESRVSVTSKKDISSSLEVSLFLSLSVTKRPSEPIYIAFEARSD